MVQSIDCWGSSVDIKWELFKQKINQIIFSVLISCENPVQEIACHYVENNGHCSPVIIDINACNHQIYGRAALFWQIRSLLKEKNNIEREFTGNQRLLLKSVAILIRNFAL